MRLVCVHLVYQIQSISTASPRLPRLLLVSCPVCALLMSSCREAQARGTGRAGCSGESRRGRRLGGQRVLQVYVRAAEEARRVVVMQVMHSPHNKRRDFTDSRAPELKDFDRFLRNLSHGRGGHWSPQLFHLLHLVYLCYSQSSWRESMRKILNPMYVACQLTPVVVTKSSSSSLQRLSKWYVGGNMSAHREE